MCRYRYHSRHSNTITINLFWIQLGEVWTEVVTELEQEGVRPISPDSEALEAISRTITDRAEHVLQVQKELLDAQQQQDALDEQEFYAEARCHSLWYVCKLDASDAEQSQHLICGYNLNGLSFKLVPPKWNASIWQLVTWFLLLSLKVTV